MVCSPLAGGFIERQVPPRFRGPPRRATYALRLSTGRARARLQRRRRQHGVSVARVALAWLLHQKSVMSVIVGAKTAEQLTDNKAAAKLALNEDNLALLDKASAL